MTKLFFLPCSSYELSSLKGFWRRLEEEWIGGRKQKAYGIENPHTKVALDISSPSFMIVAHHNFYHPIMHTK